MCPWNILLAHAMKTSFFYCKILISESQHTWVFFFFFFSGTSLHSEFLGDDARAILLKLGTEVGNRSESCMRAYARNRDRQTDRRGWQTKREQEVNAEKVHAMISSFSQFCNPVAFEKCLLFPTPYKGEGGKVSHLTCWRKSVSCPDSQLCSDLRVKSEKPPRAGCSSVSIYRGA